MDELKKVIESFDIYKYGFVKFEYVKLFQVASSKRIPMNAKTVIAFVFPYYSKEIVGGNISAYCAVRDYHIVVREKLNELCNSLRETYPEEVFEPFVDSSPINEVDLCVKAGLGRKGKHSLLIDEVYGSFVFLGEIVTSLFYEETSCEAEKTCIGCNLCRQYCPGQALGEDGLSTEFCASFLTQKKGDLSEIEVEIIQKAGLLWGCDTCQLICPHNREIPDCNNEFSKGIISSIEKETVGAIYKQRAFGFRGLKVLERNLELLNRE